MASPRTGVWTFIGAAAAACFATFMGLALLASFKVQSVPRELSWRDSTGRRLPTRFSAPAGIPGHVEGLVGATHEGP